jgi:hypothetical protein
VSGAPAGRRSAQGGFALIIVLWTAALLSLLMTQIEQAGQNETRRVLNLRRAAALQAEADGAVAVAAFHLLGPAHSWSADGQSHVLRVDGGGQARRGYFHLALPDRQRGSGGSGGGAVQSSWPRAGAAERAVRVSG